jgi:cytochrome c551
MSKRRTFSGLRCGVVGVRCWVLGVGYWVLGVRYWVLGIRSWVLVAIGISITGCSRDPKFQQYFVEGEKLYEARCSNCHQKSGKGLGLVYPPLAASDFMDANPERVMCLMKWGIKGQIIVNGNNFNQAMPGIPSLTELEIAEIATFIYNSWGREKGIIEVATASKALQACPPQ